MPGWRFTLQAPSYMALATYLDDGDTREKAWRAFNTRATHYDWAFAVVGPPRRITTPRRAMPKQDD